MVIALYPETETSLGRPTTRRQLRPREYVAAAASRPLQQLCFDIAPAGGLSQVAKARVYILQVLSIAGFLIRPALRGRAVSTSDRKQRGNAIGGQGVEYLNASNAPSCPKILFSRCNRVLHHCGTMTFWRSTLLAKSERNAFDLLDAGGHGECARDIAGQHDAHGHAYLQLRRQAVQPGRDHDTASAPGPPRTSSWTTSGPADS